MKVDTTKVDTIDSFYTEEVDSGFDQDTDLAIIVSGLIGATRAWVLEGCPSEGPTFDLLRRVGETYYHTNPWDKDLEELPVEVQISLLTSLAEEANSLVIKKELENE